MTERTSCLKCGEYFNATGIKNRVCALCRDVVIQLFDKMAPCCREAYCRGRISAASEQGDVDTVRALGQMLDQMRDDADV